VYIHVVRRTRLSFLYLAAYLLGAGVALAFVPSVALKLLFSNGNYGDVMPRLLGVVLLALGLIIVQIIRHRVEALYLTTLGVRVIIVAGLVSLFIYSRDPLFISLTIVVGIGMILTGTSYLVDRRHITE
jgi:thiol:disulfide interchange protein